MNNKTKRLIILLLDVAIGVIVEIWASNTYPNFSTLWIILFFLFLIIRLLIDWFLQTIEDKFYDLQIEAQIAAMENDIELQKTIQRQMLEAIEDGNIGKFKKFDKLKKNL